MKFNLFQSFCLLLALSLTGFFAASLQAQQGVTFREVAGPLRTTSVANNLPCAGSQIFFEDFESGTPAGWIIVDGDNLTPRAETGLAKGWQIREDYLDTTNHAMVTPSWYDPVGQSDDWLITPQITLGSNSCLSWRARSQDQFYKESYEVRISTTTPDTSAFLADSALVTISAEQGTDIIRSTNLSAWANQNVYVAFRQTSDDKFVLVLDEIKVSNVNNRDIGVIAFDYGSPQPGDTVRFEVEVANFGSDTIKSFNLIYSIQAGTPQSMAVDSIVLPPNATIFIDHDAFFISDSTDRFYDGCFWTSFPNNSTDEDRSNDTLCAKVAVGSPVGRPDPQFPDARILVFPNPFGEGLNLETLELPGKTEVEIRLYDVLGREQYLARSVLQSGKRVSLATGPLPSGMYLLQITSGDRVLLVRRLLRE